MAHTEADTKTPPLTAGLRARVGRALAWNLSFNLVRDVLQFGVTLILVRLLDPAAYGMAALVNGGIAFLAVFSLNAFLAHGLQLEEGREVDYQSHFTVGGFQQGALFLIAQLAGLGLWWSEDYEAIAPLVHFYAFRLLLDWPGELRRAMLQRGLDWSRLVFLDTAGLLAGALLGLVLAWSGAGVYALLAPGLVTPLALAVDLFLLARWRPEFRFDALGHAPALAFGLRRMGSLAADRGRTLLETALVVHLAGFAATGLFGRANALAALFCQRLAVQAMAAIYPAFARMDATDHRYRDLGLRALQGVFWLALPMGVLLAGLAEPAVRIVYGAQWLQAAELLPPAVGLSVLAAMSHVGYLLLLGANGQDDCLRADLLRLLLVVPALIWVLPRGLAMYLWSIAGLELLVLAYLLRTLFARSLLNGGDLLRALWPALFSALLALALAKGLSARAGFEGGAESLLYSAVFVSVYGLALWYLFPSASRRFLRALPWRWQQ